jgi:hypothetical protein
MRAARARGVNALALAVAVVLIGGCTASGQSASPPAPTPVTSGNVATYAAAIAEVQAYLDMWVRDGPYAAAAKYLVPEEQAPSGAATSWPPSADDEAPVLLSGKVESYQLREWKSLNEFTLLVTMDWHFRGDPARWNANEGANSRFFRFTRPDATSAFRMYEATSP